MKKKHINNLRTALMKHPHLSDMSQDRICEILQSLFIFTGCNYVSYFKLIGKATILSTFFQYASFITGPYMPGSLLNTSEHSKEAGFLSFIGLVGTLCFKNI